MPRQRTKASTRTSWDPVARWYAGWAGKRGSIYHKRIAIPTVLRLLELQRGERVLDVGCGHGVLASHVLGSKAAYVGVDASQRLIAHARKSQPAKATFAVGDAAQLRSVDVVAPGTFDAVVFMLSIQDMEPLDAILAGASSALSPKGRLVIFMLHPCFRVPRQSGWGIDPKRKLTYRRVDRYLSELRVPMKAYQDIVKGARGTTLSFHRPLSSYVNLLADSGMTIDRLEEHADPISGDNDEIPLFAALRARNNPAKRPVQAPPEGQGR